MDALITVEGVEKDFGNQVKALDQINLEIASGDIYGIIGMSGAGKSTLVRCLNYLEKPTAGVVKIHGKDLSTLKGRQLRKERQKIAMIFQYLFSACDRRSKQETGKEESCGIASDRGTC